MSVISEARLKLLKASGRDSTRKRRPFGKPKRYHH